MKAAYSGVGSVRTTPPSSWLRAESEARRASCRKVKRCSVQQAFRATFGVSRIQPQRAARHRALEALAVAPHALDRLALGIQRPFAQRRIDCLGGTAIRGSGIRERNGERPAAGTARSGARSRTSSDNDATRARVWVSAPNSSARRPTSALRPTPVSAPAAVAESGASAPLSDEEFGGINMDTALLQRAFDAIRRLRIHLRLSRQIEDQLRFFRVALRVEHHHDTRKQPSHAGCARSRSRSRRNTARPGRPPGRCRCTG